jgi:hypothetical protein
MAAAAPAVTLLLCNQVCVIIIFVPEEEHLQHTCQLQDGEVPPVFWLKVAQVPAIRPRSAPAANQVSAPLGCKYIS